MENISELLQQAKSVKREPVDEKLEWSKWGKAKAKMNQLPPTYEKIIEEKIASNASQVKLIKKTNGSLYEYKSQIDGYEASLIWKKHKKNEDTAYYVLWNPTLGHCYIRDLTNI